MFTFLLAIACCWSVTQGTNFTCHGDVTALTVTGASASTASQDGLSGGVTASYKMLDKDYAELNKRKRCYYQAGVKNCIQPAVIAALASRESRGGSKLYGSGGYGNGGSSYGILQCNSKTTSLDCDKYAWDSCQHINFMVHSFLIPRIKAVRQAHPSWTQDQTLQAGISVYNTGVTNVQTVAGVDSSTQGRDFSNDVCARAQRLINHHKWE